MLAMLSLCRDVAHPPEVCNDASSAFLTAHDQRSSFMSPPKILPDVQFICSVGGKTSGHLQILDMPDPTGAAKVMHEVPSNNFVQAAEEASLQSAR